MHDTSTLDRLYVCVRGDLPPGLQAAQAIHAAMEFAVTNPTGAAAWHRASNFLVVVTAPDEAALMDLITAAHQAQVPRYAVREPDVGDEITAVALGPGAGARRVCANLPLALRDETTTKVPALVLGRVTVPPGPARTDGSGSSWFDPTAGHQAPVRPASGP